MSQSILDNMIINYLRGCVKTWTVSFQSFQGKVPQWSHKPSTDDFAVQVSKICLVWADRMIGPRHAHAHAFKSGEPEAVCEHTVRFRAKSQGDCEGIKKMKWPCGCGGGGMSPSLRVAGLPRLWQSKFSKSMPKILFLFDLNLKVGAFYCSHINPFYVTYAGNLLVVFLCVRMGCL